MNSINNQYTMLPKFQNYREEGKTDNGYETLQDFFLSWTIRSAADEHRDNPIYEYCQKIVYLLINGENDKKNDYDVNWNELNNFKIIKVETRRQEGKIDLIALLEIEDQNGVSKHLLNIENKWYSGLGDHQLKKYKTYIEKNYSEYNAHHLYITCDDCRPNYLSEIKQCRENNYTFITIDQIKLKAELDKETKNALFDAYWFE